MTANQLGVKFILREHKMGQCQNRRTNMIIERIEAHAFRELMPDQEHKAFWEGVRAVVFAVDKEMDECRDPMDVVSQLRKIKESFDESTEAN